ncbi:MAG: SCO family protein [Pseudomonadota bacterium]
MQFSARFSGWMTALLLGLWVVVPSVIDIVTSEQFNRAATPRPAVVPELELTAHTGAVVTQADLPGQPTAVFFGFTHCPDVCPTTLQDITRWLDELGSQGLDMQVWFITLDPERDTRTALAAYLEAFSSQILGLTGEPAAIERAAGSFSAYRRKVSLGDDATQYTLDHTASIYLFDRSGRFQDLIAFGEQDAFALNKLRKLVAHPDQPPAG